MSSERPAVSDDERALALLDELIGKPTAPRATPLVIEARRLRHIVGRWHAVPPSVETRAAMMVRIAELLASAQGAPGTSAPSLPIVQRKS